MTFILSTFEIHIEYHSDDENHFHLVLVNGHSQIAFRFPRERDIAIVAKVSTRQKSTLEKRRNEKYNFACLILGLIPWTISHFLFRKLCCNLLFSAELKPRGCYYSALKSAKMLKTNKFDSLSPMT